MSERATFPMNHLRYRQFAHAMIDKVPDNWICILQPEKRSLEQNKALWSKLSDIANTPDLKWAGHEFDAWGWKDLFVSAYLTHKRKETAGGEQPKIIGGIEGEILAIGLKSSELTKEQFSELLSYIDHWGSSHGVVWTEPKPKDEPPPHEGYNR